jgi:signal peptidase I
MEVCFRVSSGSMNPVLSTGNRIGVQGRKGSYGFGDIVLFQWKGGLCVHRIIMRKDGHFITKGDRKVVPDPALRKERILGRAVWVEKFGRRFSLENHLARSVGVLLGVLSLIEYYIWREVWTGAR